MRCHWRIAAARLKFPATCMPHGLLVIVAMAIVSAWIVRMLRQASPKGRFGSSGKKFSLCSSTMLSAARNLARYRVPLTGINQGRVGFMTDIALQDMHRSVGAILEGQYGIEERALLEAEITRGGASVLRTLALNEAVVGRGSQGRLIEVEVRINGEYVYALRADGLIVATPTGSTAYALSAQGPILQPGVAALALVPLNPHVLSARPVSVSDRSVIEIALLRAVDARAHFDGFALADMAQGDRLVLKRSPDSVRGSSAPCVRPN